MKTRLLLFALLLPLVASADAVEINGICYNLDTAGKTAEVTMKPSGSYTGAIVIPTTVVCQRVKYKVTGIGESAFQDCPELTSITIPTSVTGIGDFAFRYCPGLTSISIPNSVRSIGRDAFYCCYGLTSVSIPKSVTSMGNNVFACCHGLTSIVVEPGNPNYDSRGNCNAIIETASNTLISGCKRTVIPRNVTGIGDSAFNDCSGLTSVSIPDSVTSIGMWAFSSCSDLVDVTIGTGIKKIESRAWSLCKNLSNVYCFSESVPVTDPDAFSLSDSGRITLHVPPSLINEYKAAIPWNKFKEVVAIN